MRVTYNLQLDFHGAPVGRFQEKDVPRYLHMSCSRRTFITRPIIRTSWLARLAICEEFVRGMACDMTAIVAKARDDASNAPRWSCHVVPRGGTRRPCSSTTYVMRWAGSLYQWPCLAYGRPARMVIVRSYNSSSSTSLMRRLVQPWQAKFHAWVEKTKPVASSRLTELSHKWNDYSGYAEIHALKEQVQIHCMYLGA